MLRQLTFYDLMYSKQTYNDLPYSYTLTYHSFSQTYHTVINMTVFEKWCSVHCQLKLSIMNINNNTKAINSRQMWESGIHVASTNELHY